MNDIKIVSGKGRNAAQKQKAPKAQKPPKPERRKSSAALKAALIVPAVIILCMAAGVVALAFYVDNLDTVFPNVWADGVKLSGMTLSEASDTLNGAGYNNSGPQVDASATIVLSSDIRFTIYSYDVHIAGVPINAEDAAVAAFEIGRNGSRFENTRTFLSSLFNDTEIRSGGGVGADSIDEDYILYTVSRYTQKFNNTLFDGIFELGENSITIAKGAGVEPIDELEVFDMTLHTITQAIEWNEHLIAEFEPTSSEEIEVDFEMLFNRIHVDPIEAHFAPGTFDAVEGTPGITFDLELAQQMFNSARSGEEIVIPLIILYPEITAEYLESMLFRDILGTRTTSAAGSASGRLHNIRHSTELIDGTILMPGEIFSFNEVVGQRTTERGFQLGGAFIGGRLEQAIGGGICQTSSTLYNAVLYAGLEVVTRRPHSFIVTYLPFGLDAMIYWPGSDLRFRNSTDYPIRVEGFMEGVNVGFRILGTETRDYTIRLRSVTVGSVAIRTQYIEDEDMAPGTTRVQQGGATGITADVFIARIDADGNVIDEQLLNRNSYAMMYRIVYRGPELEEEDEPEQPPDQDEQPSPYQGEQPPVQQPDPPDDAVPYTPEQTPPPQDDYNPYA